MALDKSRHYMVKCGEGVVFLIQYSPETITAVCLRVAIYIVIVTNSIRFLRKARRGNSSF